MSALRCTTIPNGNPMAKICSMIASISHGRVGAGIGGVALSGVTIMFMTMKTPNPYRSEPTITLRRKRGMRLAARMKTAATANDMIK